MPARPLRRPLLAACLCAAFAALPLSASADTVPVVQPNPHLTVEGIPPIPQALAERVARYTDFRPRKLVDWHPVWREMLVSTRTSGTTVQLHLLKKPMGELEQLTDFPDPVREARFEPKNGNYIVFEKDEGGSEATQLYRLDLDSRKITLLTSPNEKHGMGEWNHTGTQLLTVSTQLDKTAGAERRKEVTTEVTLLDPAKPESAKKIASLPGGGWDAFQWSPDDKQLVAMNYKSANETSLWLIDAASGERRQLLPQANAAPAFYGTAYFSRDGKRLIATSDRSGEFRQLISVELGSMQVKMVSADIPWDVDETEPARDSDRLAAVINADGMEELHFFDTMQQRELPRPPLPVGSVSGIKWRPSNERELGFSLESAHSPGELYALDTQSGKIEQWTTPASSTDTSGFADTQIVRWKSFDGRSISGLLTKPAAASHSGKRPVVILIHGGPEGQAKFGFIGRYNYVINELGLALIQPNVRGSTGYGKTFLKLDNGVLREDSVKDIGALLDWIAQQPDLDASRVLVMGGSYGGYMSLAVSTHYADRIAGSVDVVGISNFVSFLERTESYRRDLRRVEYGDERDPQMRDFLERISPLNNAGKITKPLLVVQGKNDPRVPLYEAEQIVARVRQNGTPVWYLMADNEGHGFARKPNADFYFYSVLKFMEQFLLQ